MGDGAGTSSESAPDPGASAVGPAAVPDLRTLPDPRDLADVDPDRSLAPLAPGLRLTGRLAADPLVTTAPPSWWARLGWGTALVGLAVWIVRGLVPSLGIWGLVVAWLLIGAGTGLLAWTYSRKDDRRIGVSFAPTQSSEWRRAERTTRWIGRARWAVAGVGLAAALALAILLWTLEGPNHAAVWTMAALAVLAGGAWGPVWLLHRSAVRSYVQTMILALLERAGTPSPSASAPAALPSSVEPVLLALDDLLGALPEAEIQRFMQMPEAEAYLSLMERLRGDP